MRPNSIFENTGIFERCELSTPVYWDICCCTCVVLGLWVWQNKSDVSRPLVNTLLTLFILVFDVIMGYFCSIKWICTPVLSAFCRIGPTVAYIWRSVANKPKLAKFTQLVYKVFPLMYDVIIIREWFVSLGAVWRKQCAVHISGRDLWLGRGPA